MLHIVGIGNTLLGDDGVGPRVVETLLAEFDDAEDLDLIDGGTLGFALTAYIEDAEFLVVIDAARNGLAPGTVSAYENEEMDRFIARRGRSVHEVGLADAMDMARLAGRLPARRILIGIEPDRVDWSDRLTPRVSRAAREAAGHVRRLVAEYRAGRTSAVGTEIPLATRAGA